MTRTSGLAFMALLSTGLLTGKASAESIEKIVAVQQAQIARQQEQIKKLIADTEGMKSDLSTCKSNDVQHKWTEGSLCVLANGSCPAGFTTQEGYIRGMSIFVNQNSPNSYLSPSQFGSSNIRWHGEPYQYGTWAAELNLKTCCK